MTGHLLASRRRSASNRSSTGTGGLSDVEGDNGDRDQHHDAGGHPMPGRLDRGPAAPA